MSTPFTEFYETLRHLLGDRDAAFRQYPDAALDGGLRAVFKMGKIPGYTLDGATAITPEVTDPNKYALIIYHTAKSFVISNPDHYSYATRALKESFGSYKDFVWDLEMNLHQLESGTMFLAWQSFYAWVEGVSGLPLAAPLTRVDVRAPFVNVSITNDGAVT